MNISLDLYKTFYYVAKNQNISRASVELNISQPAISKAIKTLEEQLNTTLFIRKRDGVLLTEIGEVFYDKIKDAMEIIASCENDLQVMTSMEAGNLNIGASKTILHEFLMPYIVQFHQQYPKINIRIFTDKTADVIKKAKMGIVDVIFTNLPYDLPHEFEFFKIMELHDCFAFNSNYSHLINKKMKKKDLEELPLLVLTNGATTRIRLDNYCHQNHITIHPEMEFGSNSLIKEFTLNGFGVGLLTEEHIKEELENGLLYKLDFDFEFSEKYLGMVWNKENRSLVSKNFIKYIKNNITI